MLATVPQPAASSSNPSLPSIQTRDANLADLVLRYRDTLGNRFWRLNNLYWITDKDSREMIFRMNMEQEQLLRNLHHRNIILKARQIGFTTLVDIFILDSCLFQPNLRCGIIAHSMDDARVIFRDKVRFAYDCLNRHPFGALIQEATKAREDKVMELTFANNSNVRVATSFRSGVLQILHVSEYAKICARYPEKAREIRTGALNAVAKGLLVFVEGTAEGRSGDFYDMCKVAEKKRQLGLPLTPLDFKHHFFPWQDHPEYTLDPEGVVITSEMKTYFRELEEGPGIKLTPGQKAWYVKMKETQKDEMTREYPATSEEAFLAALKGAFYGVQMAKVRREKRICGVPHDPRIPVNTAWDLGYGSASLTSIIFHQRVGRENHIIDYYQDHKEGFPHYVKILAEKGYVYGNHYLPHDIGHGELGTGVARLETLRNLMPTANLVVVPKLDIPDGIDAVKNVLGSCWFDHAKTDDNLVRALENYQREWDESLGSFKSSPRKDKYSHPSDAMRYLAIGLGYYPAASGPIQPDGKSGEKWKRRNRSAMAA